MANSPREYDLGNNDLVGRSDLARWFPGRNLVTSLRYRGRDFRYRSLFDVLRRHCQGRVLDVGGGAFVTTAIEERVPFAEWTIMVPVCLSRSLATVPPAASPSETAYFCATA